MDRQEHVHFCICAYYKPQWNVKSRGYQHKANRNVILELNREGGRSLSIVENFLFVVLWFLVKKNVLSNLSTHFVIKQVPCINMMN